MPLRLRPMSRWISTVRPSGRPLVTSRALRSPVDAGSIAYSAVTQPRPLPAIQRGTDSCADAVQITRVSPQLLDVAERQLQEARALRPERGGLASAEESVGPLAAVRAVEPARAKH